MGRPKAALEFDGEPLLAHLSRRLHSIAAEVIVVAAPGQELPDVGPRVDDEMPGAGPLAGIAAGMRRMSTEWAFACSCDAPFLPTVLPLLLLEKAGDAEVVVPERDGRLHPLQALYRRSALPVMDALLAAGRRRPMDLFDAVYTIRVGDRDLRPLDPDGLAFFNMNEPADYERALQLWKARR
jgi:molybdopterin-guanine dinucleotide biosynthesis protein A